MIDHLYKAKSEIPNALVAVFLGTIVLYVLLIGEPLIVKFRGSLMLDDINFNSLGYRDALYVIILISILYMIGITLIYIGAIFRKKLDPMHNVRYEFAILNENSRIYEQYTSDSKISNLFSSCGSLSFICSLIFVIYGVAINWEYIAFAVILFFGSVALIRISIIPFRDFDRLMLTLKTGGAESA